MKWMFGRTAQWLWATFASAAVAFAVGQTQLPEGDGKNILEHACTTCHDLDLVTSPASKRDKDAWQTIVVSMRDDQKAEISEAETAILVDYLVKNFGDKPADAQAPAGNSPADETTKLIATSCTVCHDMDLISGYKGSKDDWNGVVNSMVAYGAELTPAQITQIVDYLAKTYPPAN